MTTANWTKAERFDGDNALIAADLDNGARAVIYGDYQDEIKISLLIFDSSLPGGSASTNNTQEWPLIEQYIPRVEWLAEIWGGYRGPPSAPRPPRLPPPSPSSSPRRTPGLPRTDQQTKAPAPETDGAGVNP